MTLARERLADFGHLRISVENIRAWGAADSARHPSSTTSAARTSTNWWKPPRRWPTAVGAPPGIVDVNSTYDAGKPEVNVIVDREQAADLGVSVEDLDRAVRALIGGEEVSRFQERGETYDVRCDLAETDRRRPEAVLDLPVRTRSGRYIELRNLVRIEQETGPVQIERQDRMRQVTILGNLEPSKSLGSRAGRRAPDRDADRLARRGHFGHYRRRGPDGRVVCQHRVQYGPGDRADLYGTGRAVREPGSSADRDAFLASVNRRRVGPAGNHRGTLSIFSMIGMIMLMGLVTKNAILLVDYTNLLRSRGMTKLER